MAEPSTNYTRIHPILFTALVTAIFGLQAWSLIEIVNLKVAVAEIKVEITHHLVDIGHQSVGSLAPQNHEPEQHPD